MRESIGATLHYGLHRPLLLLGFCALSAESFLTDVNTKMFHRPHDQEPWHSWGLLKER